MTGETTRPVPTTIRVVVPLAFKRRNGRPRILAPADTGPDTETRLDPRLARAIARAWSWRRRLERGEVATLRDIADAERVTVPFVSRFIRLAYLSPVVLEQLLIHRSPSALSIEKLAVAALASWVDQQTVAFDD